jgi:DNA-binding response OmpR family regulator
MAGTILVVEDDPEALRSLSTLLQSSDHHVTGVDTGEEARSILRHMQPDLILLDLMLPDTDGLVLIGVLKKLTSAPIIILSARHEQVDRVLAFKLGADDFIAKPFDIDELEARIDAVLRRTSPTHKTPTAVLDQLRVDELIITDSRRTVTLAGQPVHLTVTEYRLVVALASRPKEVLSRKALAQMVWGYEDVDVGHLIDVHVGRLRQKLRHVSPGGTTVHTVRGRGYAIGSESYNPGIA